MKKILIISVLFILLCGCNKSPATSDADILEKENANPPVSKVALSESEIENEETKQESVETEKTENGVQEVEESSIEKKVDYWRVISDTINLRKSPDIKSQSIAIGKKDQDLEYLHQKYFDPSDNRIWYNIKNKQGTIGWVSSVVVAPSDGQNFNQNDNQISSLQVMMKSNIRKEPSIESESVSIVQKDDRLYPTGGPIIDGADGRIWYPIKTKSDETGWISSKVIEHLSNTNLDLSNPETYVGNWDRFLTPADADNMLISLTLEKENNGYSFYINDKYNYLGVHAGTAGKVIFDNQGKGQATIKMSSKTGSEGEYEYTSGKGTLTLLDTGILYNGPIMSGNDGYSDYTFFFEMQWKYNEEDL
ncbi:SH3 domain-containing protein [Paenibacillus xylanilyticus]|uniref:SH3 domain-containing protein n=1 Tax=Paenibacillus xylanilyticus TaxID=248903 RepID=A0A7Y6BVI0_9BACL|nr:SH3 domain-containing protein [Paenibacillus xylanilyticus]NUU75762.1 hypothetical protein [Paenibacillus xylanilyticus]